MDIIEKNDPEVSIVLPAFNEEKNIGATIKKLHDMYPAYEILVVDDGSVDNTRKIALDAGAKVYSHPYNLGNGAAVKSGLRKAQGTWILLMDADGQHDPNDIPRLLEYKATFDMVVGARTRSSETSLHRDLANIIYNKFATYVCKFKIDDLTSGFRLVNKETVTKFIYLLPNTFSYPSTITISYLRSGFTVKYVPIVTKQRKGKSKIKLASDGARFFLIITRIATLFSPLRVFLPISILLFFTGLGYYCYTFLLYHRFTNMSMLLFVSSLIIFMIGLVSEQVSMMRFDRSDH